MKKIILILTCILLLAACAPKEPAQPVVEPVIEQPPVAPLPPGAQPPVAPLPPGAQPPVPAPAVPAQ